MAKIVLPKDLARAIVDSGKKLTNKTTQTVRRAPDSQEPVVVLFKITGRWAANEYKEYYTTGHIITAQGVAESGDLYLFAPTVTYTASQASGGEEPSDYGDEGGESDPDYGGGGGELDPDYGGGELDPDYGGEGDESEHEKAEAPDLPYGIVHAALVNGRYELIGGGGIGEVVEPLWRDEEGIHSGVWWGGDIKHSTSDDPDTVTTNTHPFVNSCHVEPGRGIEFFDAGWCGHSYDPIIVGIRMKEQDIKKGKFVKSLGEPTKTTILVPGTKTASGVASIEAETAEFVSALEPTKVKFLTEVKPQTGKALISLGEETTKVLEKVEGTPAKAITKVKPTEGDVIVKVNVESKKLQDIFEPGKAVDRVEAKETADCITEFKAPTELFVQDVETEPKTIVTSVRLVSSSAAEGGFQIVTGVTCEDGEIKVITDYIGLSVATEVVKVVKEVPRKDAVTSVTPNNTAKAIVTLDVGETDIIKSGSTADAEVVVSAEPEPGKAIISLETEDGDFIEKLEPSDVEVIKSCKPEDTDIVTTFETSDAEAITEITPTKTPGVASVSPTEASFVTGVEGGETLEVITGFTPEMGEAVTEIKEKGSK